MIFDIRRVRMRAFATLAIVAAAQPLGAQTRASGIDTTNFDRSIRPQDDFFRFVNGGWLARATIPSDASRWGAFDQLRDDSRSALHVIADEAMAATSAPGADRRKVGDLYASFMDSARVEQLGVTPLQGELRTIAALTMPAQLPTTFAHFARIGVNGPMGVSVGPDAKQSTVNTVAITQSGLGLPDRDYYLLQDAKMTATRQAYQGYIARLFTLAKQPDPSGAAARVLALETALAQKHWDRARSRNRNATYNKMTVAQLAAQTPSYDWSSYLAAAGLGTATEVVVRQPDYLKAMDSIVAATPVSTWRDYLTFKLLDHYTDELPAAFQQARFEFRGRTLSGQQEMAVRWKRGVAEATGALGEAMGKLYVERNFKPEAKARMDALVRNILAAYRVGIDSLEWMSPETKAQAKDKLAKFTVKIAYP
ncbi:MAG: peptidase M13, partial [Gemmatimonadaceae bacterium]|nr:peptidase M13 [Gemmatimonadaceae bacterium]